MLFRSRLVLLRTTAAVWRREQVFPFREAAVSPKKIPRELDYRVAGAFVRICRNCDLWRGLLSLPYLFVLGPGQTAGMTDEKPLSPRDCMSLRPAFFS